MFKRIFFSLAATFALMISGCSSVEVARNLNKQQLTVQKQQPIANINVDVYGYFFFSEWPCCSGSTEKEDATVWFEDTVKIKNCVDMLTRKSKEIGARKTVDMQTFYESEWIPWTLVLWCHEIHVSGNALK